MSNRKIRLTEDTRTEPNRTESFFQNVPTEPNRTVPITDKRDEISRIKLIFRGGGSRFLALNIPRPLF